MENSNTEVKTFVQNECNVGHEIFGKIIPTATTGAFPVFEKLVAEGSTDFINYIDWLGFSEDQNLIVLPSYRHYYYDSDDLKEVKAVVILKQLNQIKHIRDFLKSIHNILPLESNFIGSFVDGENQSGFFSNSNKSQYNMKGKTDPLEYGIESRNPFMNMIYDIMDSRTNRYMTRSTAISILKDDGLNVSDMTSVNGITYFCAVNARVTA